MQYAVLLLHPGLVRRGLNAWVVSATFARGKTSTGRLLRFLHSLVVHQQQFIRIRITFPICAHSYMECDGDMVAINQKPRVETPIGWVQQFEGARKSPSPFNVVAVQQDTFLQMTNHVKVLYKATPQFPTRPIREKFSQETTQGSSSTVLIRMGLLKHLSCQTSWQKRSSPAATSLPYLSRENSSDSDQIQGLADPGDLLLGNRSAVLWQCSIRWSKWGLWQQPLWAVVRGRGLDLKLFKYTILHF